MPVEQPIDVQKLLHEEEGLARIEDLILMSDLIAPVGLQPLLLVDPVAFVEIEQRPGADGDGEGLVCR